MDDLISRIATTAGLEPAVAQEAVVAILGFLHKEGPKPEMDAVLAAIPGAVEALPAASSGGLGGLMGMLGSAGGLMGLAGHLSSLGLGMDDMQSVGKELFAYASEKVGHEKMQAVAEAIPGLAQFV